jgi:hypothetical protein
LAYALDTINASMLLRISGENVQNGICEGVGHNCPLGWLNTLRSQVAQRLAHTVRFISVRGNPNKSLDHVGKVRLIVIAIVK